MIRVDQSHCNYRLSVWLRDEGWTVLFRDPGRASRGLTGTQETLLGIFERNSWPIPDIVAIKQEDLLLVEIDHRLQVAENSFIRYRTAAEEIICATVESGAMDERALSLRLGFCKIGALKHPEKTLVECPLDFVAWFDDPMTPSVIWRPLHVIF
jgi:hypothetical protein